jgi:hypothetical protein
MSTAEQAPPDAREDAGENTRHWLYRLMENPWLLLALGVAVPTLSYTVWGWVELLLTKKAELP